MEKKTRFKLKFINAHILKNQNPKKASQKRRFMKKETAKQIMLFKHFNPISIHRTVGDLVFLDYLNNYDEFIPLSTLWKHFKSITEIVTTENFSICTKIDIGYYSSNVGLLVDRLLSLGEQNCYNLALTISSLWKSFNQLPLAQNESTQIVNFSKNSINFDTFCKENLKVPMILYHYTNEEQLGMSNFKITINKALKEITFQDDLSIFEESLFVVPTNEYFPYILNHLKSCFLNKEELILLYLNSNVGVKKVFAKGFNFLLEHETIVALVFPKESQSFEVQNMFDGQREQPSKNKKQSALIKNFEDWEKLIKNYYDPLEIDQEKLRCKYRMINVKKENQANPFISKYN